MTFGEKLFALRRQAGYSQEEMADRLEISRQAVSRWEMGTTLPDAQNLIRLSKIFGVSIDSMLNDGMELTGEKQPAMEENVERIPKEEQIRRLVFGALMGLYTGALCLGLAGWIASQRILAMLLPMAIHIVGTVVFETVWRSYGGILPAWRNRYYRTAIWVMAWFPCWLLGRMLWQIYPSPYNGMFPLLTAVALYLAVCFAVRHRFRGENL